MYSASVGQEHLRTHPNQWANEYWTGKVNLIGEGPFTLSPHPSISKAFLVSSPEPFSITAYRAVNGQMVTIYSTLELNDKH